MNLVLSVVLAVHLLAGFSPSTVAVAPGQSFDVTYGLRNWSAGTDWDTWELYWHWDSTKMQLIGCTVLNAAPHTCGTFGDNAPTICPTYGYACNEAKIYSGACCGGCHFTGPGDLVTVHMRALPGASGTSVIMPADIDHRLRQTSFFLAGNSVPCFSGCVDLSGTTVTIGAASVSEDSPQRIEWYDVAGRRLAQAPVGRGVYFRTDAGNVRRVVVIR